MLNTRSTDKYENFPRPNEKYYKSFFPHLTRSWNNLDRVRKGENFPDSKIFVAKTFRIKPVNCIIFQIRDKYA